jgi:short-subunit dehydrogenase
MTYDGLSIWWRQQRAKRPGWMNGLMYFSIFMALVYMPWDIFLKPIATDRQVWFGLMFRGWAAKIAALPHWAIYALGAYGFWHMRTWMWPWAALYVAQIAFAMLIWNLAYVGGARGVLGGFAAFAVFTAVALALWRARPLFQTGRASMRERYGEWAIVTGASAGIGTEFARALAREGMSCVLSARRGERLAALAKEIGEAHGVATRVVAADLGTPGGAEKLLEAVSDLEVAVLVNNAGYGYAGSFDLQDAERQRAMVHLNCVTPMVLSNRLLPAMRARGRGAMIIVGSIAGRQPLPFNAAYAATKAFDAFLGEALWAEMMGSGVDVLTVEPGPTATEFQQVAGETPHAGEPAWRVVAVALSALGRQPSVMSGWFNWLRASFSRLAPRSLTTLVAGSVMAQWVPPETRRINPKV